MENRRSVKGYLGDDVKLLMSPGVSMQQREFGGGDDNTSFESISRVCVEC